MERINLERNIIGGILGNPHKFISVKRGLLPEYFSKDIHKKVITSIHSLVTSGKDIDIVNIAVEGKLNSHEQCELSEIERNNACLETLTMLLTESIIIEKGKKLCDTLNSAEDCFSVMDEVKKFNADAISLVMRNTRKDKTDILNEYIEYLKKNCDDGIQRIPTGFNCLDSLFNGGFELGGFSLIGGTPGSGKTSLMLSFALNSAKAGYKTTFIEGEMPSYEIYERLNGIHEGVSIEEIRKGDKYSALSRKFISDIHSLPLEVSISTERTMNNLTNEILNAIHNGSKLILIDYLQVFADKGKGKDEFQEIKLVSESLRKLSLQYNIHLCVASSLNRNEINSNKPTLASLYGSSGLGHDATITMILNAEQNDIEELMTKKRRVFLNIVKNRTGGRGEIPMDFDLASQRFSEVSNFLND